MKIKTKGISVGDEVKPRIFLLHLGGGPKGENIQISGKFLVKSIIPDSSNVYDDNLLVLEGLKDSQPQGEIRESDCFFQKCEIQGL